MLFSVRELRSLGLVTECSGFAPHHLELIRADALMCFDQGASLRLRGAGEAATLHFFRHAWSGVAEVEDADGARTVDLYAPAYDDARVAVRGRDGVLDVRISSAGRSRGEAPQVWLTGVDFDRWQKREQATYRLSEVCSATIGVEGTFLTLASDPVIGAAIRRDGIWAADDVELFRRYVRPGATVLDIGANIGPHLVAFSRMAGPTGRVIGFEPQRHVHQLACGNVAINGCHNVEVVHCALGASDGYVQMYPIAYDEVANVGGLGVQAGTENRGGGRGETVPLRRLDALTAELAITRVDFVKIDVQAYELYVLQGAVELLARDRPPIFLEVAPAHMRRAGYDYREIYGLLGRYGYRFDHLDGKGLSADVRAWSGADHEEWDVLALAA